MYEGTGKSEDFSQAKEPYVAANGPEDLHRERKTGLVAPEGDGESRNASDVGESAIR